MSRLAKKPIPFPSGVTCTLDGSTIVIQGPKGKLDYTLHSTVKAAIEGNNITLTSSATERKEFAQWVLSWAIIRQKISGVTTENKKSIRIKQVALD